jgi:hypothetical protein
VPRSFKQLPKDNALSRQRSRFATSHKGAFHGAKGIFQQPVRERPKTPSCVLRPKLNKPLNRGKVQTASADHLP